MADARRPQRNLRLPPFRFATALLLLAVVPTLAGCRASETAAPEAGGAPNAVATRAATHPIPWFAGSVEEAFALAKAERKPVFLYWGAVWCPPCHALRTKIFPRPEFQARLAATVPVYLDGDTERAQIWGEKLGTSGYPTVIVFDADGREVTRIPSLLP
ncbi:MAG: thioredoxin family protein, partial [Thermoanaerobaculia bacterium]|nr:thioredoxin family protein [Thermoanaerobaculia bacterium]